MGFDKILRNRCWVCCVDVDEEEEDDLLEDEDERISRCVVFRDCIDSIPDSVIDSVPDIPLDSLSKIPSTQR